MEITDLAVKLEAVDQRGKSNEHRIDELETNMDKLHDTQLTLVKLANGVDKMGEQLVEMKSDIKDMKNNYSELGEKVIQLENAPAVNAKKRLDVIYDKILWVIVGGAVAALLSYLIPAIPW